MPFCSECGTTIDQGSVCSTCRAKNPTTGFNPSTKSIDTQAVADWGNNVFKTAVDSLVAPVTAARNAAQAEAGKLSISFIILTALIYGICTYYGYVNWIEYVFKNAVYVVGGFAGMLVVLFLVALPLGVRKPNPATIANIIGVASLPYAIGLVVSWALGFLNLHWITDAPIIQIGFTVMLVMIYQGFKTATEGEDDRVLQVFAISVGAYYLAFNFLVRILQ